MVKQQSAVDGLTGVGTLVGVAGKWCLCHEIPLMLRYHTTVIPVSGMVPSAIFEGLRCITLRVINVSVNMGE
jgi:hypothetical protein